MFEGMKKGLGDAIRKLVSGTAIDKKAVEEVLEEMKRILLKYAKKKGETIPEFIFDFRGEK